MSKTTITTSASRAAVRRAIGQIPAEAQGFGAAARDMMVRCGLAVLGRIREAFVVKARGGTDETGDRWAPLSPTTIAYRARRTYTERQRPSRPSQALTQRQQDRWWSLYRQGLAMFDGNKGAAARRAWAVLKREGATTLFDKYKNTPTEILRDTGLLLSTLSPGASVSEQVFRVAPGEVVVGTNREGASSHHEGIPGRLPQRRLWPPPHRWPVRWWWDIQEQAMAGLVDIATQLIEDA